MQLFIKDYDDQSASTTGVKIELEIGKTAKITGGTNIGIPKTVNFKRSFGINAEKTAAKGVTYYYAPTASKLDPNIPYVFLLDDRTDNAGTAKWRNGQVMISILDSSADPAGNVGHPGFTMVLGHDEDTANYYLAISIGTFWAYNARPYNG